MAMDEERRTTGQRVPFEALVVVASQKGGAGAYECEAVDVSEQGMHLRTAYLPDIGQSLTFRFDTGGGEVVAEGSVQWRDEQAKGGEFGVKFAKLSPEAIAAIRDVIGVPDDADPHKETPLRAARGSRVRLHIEGLASPMRARVRDLATGEVMVGSNLDFLKVGNNLELEDVDRGKKKPAIIDRVDVEVDPATNVPQLVVTLRYDGPVHAGAQIDADLKAGEAKPDKSDKSDKADKADVKASKSNKPREGKADQGKPEKADAAGSSDETPRIEGHGDEEHGDGALGDRMRKLAEGVGPRLSAAATQAKTAFAAFVARVKEKRGEGEADAPAQPDAEARPRRVTAPPPDGGLHASGRKVVRSGSGDTVDNDDVAGIEETDEELKKTRRKQRTMLAAGGSLLAILLLVFAAKARSAPPGEGAAAAQAEPALPVAALPAPRAPGAVASGDAVSANIPLFGATPLSTTEAAAMPAPPPSAAHPQMPVAAGQGDDDDGPGAADEGKPGATEFGKGDVKKPRTIKLKMDAPITDVRGSVKGNDIIITLPGRRNIEPAATLAKRDKRLSAVKAVPKDGGVELTYSFKEAPPPFLAKANGKMLEFEIGQPSKGGGGDADGDDDATLTKSKKKKKNNAVAKAEKDSKKKTAHKDGKKKDKGKKKKSND